MIGRTSTCPIIMTYNPTSTAKTVRTSSDLCVKTGTALSRDELIRRYLPLVGKVVRRMMVRLPGSADFEELHSVGITGLLAAVDRYDSTQQLTFIGYAQMRIRGAILDELRRMDSLPRSRRSKYRHLQEVVSELEQLHGRAPLDSEIAERMHMSVGELSGYRSGIQPVSVVSLDAGQAAAGGEHDEVNYHETVADERIVAPAERIERKEMVRVLGEVIEKLPERQRDVLVMYYYQGLRLAEIAEVFGVTEARACQIHAQALGSMRQRLKQID